MATSWSEQQFCCCICLDVFTDPVTLPCGHSFCKGCIEQNWVDTVIHKCPYCKQLFPTKPELKLNIVISQLSSHFRESVRRKESFHLANVAKPGEIPCDVCPEPQMKAFKSCVICLTSYCKEHLKPHQTVPGLKRHLLIEPQSNIAEKICPNHGKALELFCKKEDECLCALCARYHNGHEVVPLREVSEQKRHQLQETKTEILNMIETRQRKIEELRRSEEATNPDQELTEGLRVFTALKEALDNALENLLQEISTRQSATKAQTDGIVQELEREIGELHAQLLEIEQLTQSADPLHVLKSFKLKSSVPKMKNWGRVTVRAQRFEGTVATALSKLEEEFSKLTKETLEGELRRVRKHEKLVTLDGATAHPQLVVSQNGDRVNHSIEKRNVPNRANRFDDFFVLGKQGFMGSFYFEAEVKGKTEWALGVAKETVNRRGPLKLDPQNGVWSIRCKDKNCFAGDQQEVSLSLKAKLETVGVFVHYKEGRVSFYDVDSAALIYSFRGCSFGESVHPICSPGPFYNGNFPPVVIRQSAPFARRMTWR